MAIATTFIAGISIAVAASSADPLVVSCRLGWPNSTSNDMVNQPILLVVVVLMTFCHLSLAKVAVQLAPTLYGFHRTCTI